jgi:hypothetical protein
MGRGKIFASVFHAIELEQHSVNERAWIMGSPNLRSYFINIEEEIDRRYPSTVMETLNGDFNCNLNS